MTNDKRTIKRKPIATGFCIMNKMFHTLEPYVYDTIKEAKKEAAVMAKEAGMLPEKCFVVARISYFGWRKP